MCGPHGHYRMKHHGRSFFTKEEKIEMLERYKEWLDSESKGVSERIEELKKAS